MEHEEFSDANIGLEPKEVRSQNLEDKLQIRNVLRHFKQKILIKLYHSNQKIKIKI